MYICDFVWDVSPLRVIYASSLLVKIIMFIYYVYLMIK